MTEILLAALLLVGPFGSPDPGLPPHAAPGIGKPAESPDLAAVWRDACLWEVGSNADKVPAARKQLIAAGNRALAFMIPSKLDTKDTLATRALRVVITGIGEDAVPMLLPCLTSDNGNVRRNAADLLGALGATSAAPEIAKLLKDPDARLGALAALGALKTTLPVPEIVELMESDAPERVRYTATATLGDLGGPLAASALARELASPRASLRFAAQFALEKLKAVDVLRARLVEADRADRADQRVKLHAIAALGHIADPAARDSLRPFLDDPSPVVRGYAAEALGAMLDPPTIQSLRERLASEKDPFVQVKLASALGTSVGVDQSR